MSYQYGQLRPTPHEGQTVLTGEINSPFFVGKISLKPIDKKRVEGSPDYYIISKQNGAVFPVGKAWNKNTKDGELFFSMTLDDPTRNAPVYVSAFADDEKNGEYNIVWNRPRKQETSENNSVAEPLDDEILF